MESRMASFAGPDELLKLVMEDVKADVKEEPLDEEIELSGGDVQAGAGIKWMDVVEPSDGELIEDWNSDRDKDEYNSIPARWVTEATQHQINEAGGGKNNLTCLGCHRHFPNRKRLSVHVQQHWVNCFCTCGEYSYRREYITKHLKKNYQDNVMTCTRVYAVDESSFDRWKVATNSPVSHFPACRPVEPANSLPNTQTPSVAPSNPGCTVHLQDIEPIINQCPPSVTRQQATEPVQKKPIMLQRRTATITPSPTPFIPSSTDSTCEDHLNPQLLFSSESGQSMSSRQETEKPISPKIRTHLCSNTGDRFLTERSHTTAEEDTLQDFEHMARNLKRQLQTIKQQLDNLDDTADLFIEQIRKRRCTTVDRHTMSHPPLELARR